LSPGNAPASFCPVEIVIVKAERSGDEDRTFITRDGRTERAAVHVIHDLPHLVVESHFGLIDGLWGELAAGSHEEANRATTARHARRQKQGRIVSGGAAGVPTGQWLTEGHRLAKTVTNAVVNRWGEGPDTAAGVRARLGPQDDPAVDALLARLDDVTIDAAIQDVRELYRRWEETPPGGTLRLTWPLGKLS
jgi:hypothetical protein